MRYSLSLLTMSFVLLLFSCRKGQEAPKPPVSSPAKHILLKDITIPNLPSPFYHFEYNSDGLPVKVDFSSGFTNYDILYKGDIISEMRNNIIVNHDTLRYAYDNAGKLAAIYFINQSNITYRLVFFSYEGNHIKSIEWDHKVGNTGYLIDRVMSFVFYPDDNVKTITDYRPPIEGLPEQTLVKTLEGYDNNINVDDFILIHDGIHDHLFLLQGFRLQRGNPTKEIFSVNGVELYKNNYTYMYNPDHTPSIKTGDFIYSSGPDAGKRFVTTEVYTYY